MALVSSMRAGGDLVLAGAGEWLAGQAPVGHVVCCETWAAVRWPTPGPWLTLGGASSPGQQTFQEVKTLTRKWLAPYSGGLCLASLTPMRFIPDNVNSKNSSLSWLSGIQLFQLYF